MFNLYNYTKICISPYYLFLHNFLNKMSFIVCIILFLRNHMKNELTRVDRMSKG